MPNRSAWFALRTPPNSTGGGANGYGLFDSPAHPGDPLVVAVPGLDEFASGGAKSPAHLRVAPQCDDRSRKAWTSNGGTRRQFTPCSRTPICPAVSVQITAFPIANASRMLVIPLSLSDGKQGYDDEP